MLKFFPVGVVALPTALPAVILSRPPRNELRSKFAPLLVLLVGAAG